MPEDRVSSKGGCCWGTQTSTAPTDTQGSSRGLLTCTLRGLGGAQCPQGGGNHSPHRAARDEGLPPHSRYGFLGKGVLRAPESRAAALPHPAALLGGGWVSRRPGLVRVREEPTNPSDGSWDPSQQAPGSPHPPRAPTGLARHGAEVPAMDPTPGS